jgi:hypothetical protein
MVTMARRDQDDVLSTALLRVALALKMDPDASLDVIVERTAKAMSLSKAKLRTHLASHMALLTAQDFRRARRPAPAVGTVQATARLGGRVKSRSPR